MKLFGRRTKETNPSLPAQAEKKAVSTTKAKALREVILRPIVSEKTAHLSALNKVVFEVNKRATRLDVKQAVKSLYGIIPENVNIQVERGDRVRFGRTAGRQKGRKKAIITLPEGKKIDVHEGV